MSFEETGPISAAEWGERFGPFDEHPLTLEVRQGRAGHYTQSFSTADGDDFEVAVSAIPLVGAREFEGALVFFWPAHSR